MLVARHVVGRTLDTASTSFAGDDTTRVVRRTGLVAEQRHELDVGTCAGPYVLGKIVARGGFGNVYRAEHALLGRQTAIKLMRPEHRASPELRLRFLREAQLANLVGHPGVIQVLDAGELGDGRVWLAMELLDGEDLGQLLERERQLPLARALAVLGPLCEAIDAIHAVNVVHRDLKPANVFLDNRGRERVVVVDFGVAKRLDRPEVPLTATDHVVGTPSCMAPEQLRGQDVDVRADIYALGALVYQMTAGASPFGEGPAMMTRHLHLFARPPKLSLRAGVPPAVDDVVFRALAKSPADRHARAGELFDELRRAARGRRRAARSSAMASAIGVSVQILASSGRWPLDGLARDLASTLRAAGDALERAGFARALAGPSSLLCVRRLPEAVETERAARRDVLTLLTELAGELAVRDRLHLNLAVHVGEVAFAGGTPVGGALLRVSDWAPDQAVDGVVATPLALAGLDGIETTLIDGNSGLVRLTGAQG